MAADAAQSEAELEDNSPSGEELAEGAEEMEAASAPAPVSEVEQAASSEPSASSNQPEPSADTPVDSAGTEAAPEPSAGNIALPAEPHEEIETVPHAEKDQEER